MRSTSTVFIGYEERKQPKALAALVRHVETRDRRADGKILMTSSNYSDQDAIAAMARRDLELVYLSRDIKLDSEIADFKAELHTRVWQRIG